MAERNVAEAEFVARMRLLAARLDPDWPEAHPESRIVEYYRDRAGRAVGYVRQFTGKTDYVLIDD